MNHLFGYIKMEIYTFETVPILSDAHRILHKIIAVSGVDDLEDKEVAVDIANRACRYGPLYDEFGSKMSITFIRDRASIRYKIHYDDWDEPEPYIIHRCSIIFRAVAAEPKPHPETISLFFVDACDVHIVEYAKPLRPTIRHRDTPIKGHRNRRN